MSIMVLFEAVWLESPASQSGLAKVVVGFGRSPLQPFATSWKRACFFGLWPGFGTLTALKALGRGPGRPSWRLLERPTCSARKKARSTPKPNGSRFEPSASVRGLSLDGSDPSLSLVSLSADLKPQTWPSNKIPMMALLVLASGRVIKG